MTESSTPDTDVLVVGAGPTGLTLAIELQRRGIDCTLLEKDDSSVETSRALTIQPRTLQLFDDLGVLDAVLDESVTVDGLTLYDGSEELVRFRAESVDTTYPYLVHLAQNRTEDLLVERLRELGGDVAFNREFRGLYQDGAGVTATVAHLDDGRTERIRAQWLVGCDGGSSAVRKTLGLAFEGVTEPEQFILADAVMEWDRPFGEAGGWLHEDGAFAAFPMPPNERRWRLFAEVTEYDEADRPEPTEASFERLLRERTGYETATIRDTTWTSAFQVNQRMVRHYRRGRVFLAGDAAHVHNPIGGVGMNTGIQDAYNLGWKLALVASGAAPEALLNTYESERLPVAEDVLAGTGSALSVLTLEHPVAAFVRDTVLSRVLDRTRVQSRILRADTQLDIAYRDGPLSEAHIDSALAGIETDGGLRPRPRPWDAPKAGERAPDGPCRRLDGTDTALHREFHDHPGFVVMLFAGRAGLGDVDPSPVTDAVDDHLDGIAHTCLVIPEADDGPPARFDGTALVDDDGTLHDVYGASGPSLFLVRPDDYIAFRSDGTRPEPMVDYIDDWGFQSVA